MKNYITISECDDFCSFIDYKISKIGLRKLIDRSNLSTKKENNIIFVDRLEFVELILKKRYEKTKKRI